MGMEVRATTRRVNAILPAWASALDIRFLDLVSTSEDQLAILLQDVDAVVHLAALNSRQSAADPISAIDVNVRGTQKLILAAAERGVQDFIYVSTAHIYGSPLIGRIDEKTLPRSTHPYAWTHRAAEDIVLGTPNVGGVVLRLSNAVGAPMDAGADCWMLVALDLCRQAIRDCEMVISGDGTQVRDFISMSDVTRVIGHMLLKPKPGADVGVYNIGGKCTLSVLALAKRIAEISKINPKIRTHVSDEMGQHEPTSKSLFYAIGKIESTGFDVTGKLDLELAEILEYCRTGRTQS